MKSLPRRGICWISIALVVPTTIAAQESGIIPGSEVLPQASDWWDIGLHATARSVEAVGIAIIVLGALAATLHGARQLLRSGASSRLYETYRANLGRAILLGLEFLVAADIIGTVAVEPTLRNLTVLAVIVAIRTFLSFSLEVEIQGRWPWQQGRDESAPTASRPPGSQA